MREPMGTAAVTGRVAVRIRPPGSPPPVGLLASAPQPVATTASITPRACKDARFTGRSFAHLPFHHRSCHWRRVLPLHRLLMSFLETRAMNKESHETEVVLLGDPANPTF